MPSIIQYESALFLAAQAIEIAAVSANGSASLENLSGKYQRIVEVRTLLLP